MKEESEKAGLKQHEKKTKMMAYCPITLWQIDEKMEIVADFIFLDCKITWTVIAVMKLRYLLLGRKPVTSLNSVFKNRNITFATKMRRVKAVDFLVVIYRCDS